MAILVTGGAGYIGSHCVAALMEKGFDVVCIDNLSKGHRAAVTGGRFYAGDINDDVFLEQVFAKEKIDAVVHFAALSLVGESVKQPGRYFLNNLGGSVHLLDAMKNHGVKTIVFSSTAAVYGQPDQVPITEDMPCKPENPYGQSKLMVESALKWFAGAYGIGYACLRYFNVAGAHESAAIGEDHAPETHLIPCVLAYAQGRSDSFSIFGTDYPTPDGTCIRDYIHVSDLIEAHLLALAYLQRGGESGAFNLGLGRGFSNMEIVEAARRVTGKELPVTFTDRRAGDPAVLIASGERAKNILSWKPAHTDIEQIIASAWRWHQSHPDGYGGSQ